MVVFVPNDSYLTAYDDIRRSFRETWKPVQVLCSTSVDTVASWCLLQTCFQEDLIMYELHVVNTEEDIQEMLSTQDVFISEMEGTQVLFLNCGSSLNVLALMESQSQATVHILDGHGPVSLELLMSPLATNLYIWDAGNTQLYIENFLQGVMDDRDEEEKVIEGKRKHKKSSKSVESSHKRGLTRSIAESGDGSSHSEFTADLISSIILTPEEKLSYYSIACKNETPSFFLFNILTQLHIRVDDEVIWYRTIALTDFFFQDIPASPEYDQKMKKLHETVSVNQRNRAKYRMVSAPNLDSTEASQATMVGSYHTMQIEKSIDLPLVLLHHWTLWDAFRHSAPISSRLRLFEGQTLCKQRILDIFAYLGITQKEAKSKWTELPASRRDEIQKLLLTESIINGQALCSSYHTISKRHGYGYICGAVDMVRLLQHILTDFTAKKDKTTKKPTTTTYDTRMHRNNFFTAIDALRSKSMSDIAAPMTRCCGFYAKLVEMADGAHMKSAIKSMKTFDYLLLQDEDLPAYYLHPVALRVLSQYLVYLPVQRSSVKMRSLFIVGALDRTADEYIFVGIEQTKERMETDRGVSVIGFLFQKLALKYHEIVKHHGIDKDWIRVQRAHGLHLLDAMHIELLRMRRESS